MIVLGQFVGLQWVLQMKLDVLETGRGNELVSGLIS